jgi:hypothetical protein
MDWMLLGWFKSSKVLYYILCTNLYNDNLHLKQVCFYFCFNSFFWFLEMIIFALFYLYWVFYKIVHCVSFYCYPQFISLVYRKCGFIVLSNHTMYYWMYAFVTSTIQTGCFWVICPSLLFHRLCCVSLFNYLVFGMFYV